jgi:hypothetical protein
VKDSKLLVSKRYLKLLVEAQVGLCKSSWLEFSIDDKLTTD